MEEMAGQTSLCVSEYMRFPLAAHSGCNTVAHQSKARLLVTSKSVTSARA